MFFAVRIAAVLGVTAVLGLFDFVGRPAEAQAQAMMLPVDPAPLIAETDKGQRTFSIEIADDAAERSAGLMFRTDLPEDRGMLFILDGTGNVAFWMKNTPLPLDLIFVGADGRVKAIRHGEPESEAIISPDAPVRYVLELKAGTAARVGIEDGDLLVHPAIDGKRDAG